jgi:pimeloyl-ACP methyl ester carboxylesterase
VLGEGPALVLVHGGLGDGNPAMNPLVPSLTEKFTCFLLSTRGRGQSGDHTDHSRERHCEDIATFVDGVGEAAALFGHSGGATWSLGAASQCRALTGMAVYEPALPVSRPVISDRDYERFVAAVDAGSRRGSAPRLLTPSWSRTMRTGRSSSRSQTSLGLSCHQT